MRVNVLPVRESAPCVSLETRGGVGFLELELEMVVRQHPVDARNSAWALCKRKGAISPASVIVSPNRTCLCATVW